MATVSKNDRRTIFGWAMYDWANSAYITAGALIFSIYFADTVFPEEGIRLLGLDLDGESFWSLIVGTGAIVLFAVMPVLGAVADFSNSKRKLLRIFAFAGAGFTVLLFLPGSGDVPLAILLALGAQFGFVGANVMYDGFLPEITTEDQLDRVSAKGFALGYVGGGLHLALALGVLAFHDSLGLAETDAQRLVVLSSGVWWFAFSVFSFSRLSDVGEASQLPPEYRDGSRIAAYVRLGFRRTMTTTRRLPAFRQLMLFLVAFLIYNDGIQTIIALSPVYASETLDLSSETIAGVFLVIQIVAFFGALAFGRIADRLGTKGAILASLAVWGVLTVGGYFLPEGEVMPFLLLGMGIGFVLGGSQALSRSLYASMIPEEASAEFFGFFSVFRRLSAILGPYLFAIIDTTTGSARNAILAFVGFFAIGAFLLSKVDVEAARADKERWSFDGADAEVIDDSAG